jgi:hypothetical protein
MMHAIAPSVNLFLWLTSALLHIGTLPPQMQHDLDMDSSHPSKGLGAMVGGICQGEVVQIHHMDLLYKFFS